MTGSCLEAKVIIETERGAAPGASFPRGRHSPFGATAVPLAENHRGYDIQRSFVEYSGLKQIVPVVGDVQLRWWVFVAEASADSCCLIVHRVIGSDLASRIPLLCGAGVVVANEESKVFVCLYMQMSM